MDELFLHDDVVCAVLDFIDGYDGDVRLEIPPLHTDDASPRRPRRHSSQRMRDEIQSLRRVAEELEARMQQLVQGVAMTDETETGPNESLSWKRVALSRKIERFRAQTENARLRRLVDEHRVLARKLEKKLARRAQPRRTFVDAFDDVENDRPATFTRLPGSHTLLAASIS